MVVAIGEGGGVGLSGKSGWPWDVTQTDGGSGGGSDGGGVGVGLSGTSGW